MKKELIQALKTTGLIILAFIFFMWGGMIFGGLFFLGGKEEHKVLPFLYSSPLYLFICVLLQRRLKITQ